MVVVLFVDFLYQVINIFEYQHLINKVHQSSCSALACLNHWTDVWSSETFHPHSTSGYCSLRVSKFMNSNFWILSINSNQEDRERFATNFALRSFQGTVRFFQDDVVIISDSALINHQSVQGQISGWKISKMSQSDLQSVEQMLAKLMGNIESVHDQLRSDFQN